jgi:hypothetical protein
MGTQQFTGIVLSTIKIDRLVTVGSGRLGTFEAHVQQPLHTGS